MAEDFIEESKVRFINESSVPFLNKELSRLFPPQGIEDKSSEQISINRNSIMEVTDEEGNKSYSYQLILKDVPPNNFYNLIIDKNKNLLVFEYKVKEENLESFIASNLNFSNFAGRISIYDGTRFLNAIKNHQKSSLEPCETTEVDTGSGSTGGGSGTTNGEEQEQPIGSGTDDGNSNGDYSGGGTSECTWEVITETDTSRGTGWEDEVYILELSCPDVKSSTDCFETSGPYGINIYEYAIYKLEYHYSLSYLQLDWLKKSENSEFLVHLYSFSEAKNYSEEAENFSLEAVDAKMAGGDVDFEEQIINNLTGEAKCIYEKLRETGNDYVKNMLDKFEGESRFSLKLISEDRVFHTDENGITREVGGTTREPVNNVILIRINSSFAQNKSSLGLAKDILHEIVHADMFRKLMQNDFNTNNEDINFIETYNDFKNGNFQASPQHESMAELYVNAMSESLKQFHRSVLINDYNKYLLYYGEDPSDEFYEALAWDGLRNHDVQAYNNLPEEEQAIIESLQPRIGILTKDCFND